MLLALTQWAFGDSTVGTNFSTTGTLTVNNLGTSAAAIQNGSGTTIVQFDTTNSRLGVVPGTTLDTTLEIGGTASISGVVTLADGEFRPTFDAVNAFRFQNAAGTLNSLVIDTTNRRFGIGAIGTLNTAFEAQGTASASNFISNGSVQFANGTASVAYSRFGTSTTNHANYISASNDLLVSGDVAVIGTGSFKVAASSSMVIATTNLVAGMSVASSSTVYTGEFGSTGTTSINFGGSAANQGTCFQVLAQKSGGGVSPVYMRVVASTSTAFGANGFALKISTVKCHQ